MFELKIEKLINTPLGGNILDGATPSGISVTFAGFEFRKTDYTMTLAGFNGLDTPEAAVSTAQSANNSGERLTGVKLSSRTATLVIALEGSVTKARQMLYKIAPPAGAVRLHYNSGITGDGIGELTIDGVVKSAVAGLWDKKQTVTLTIVCPSPFLLGAAQTKNIETVSGDYKTITQVYAGCDWTPVEIDFEYDAATAPTSITYEWTQTDQNEQGQNVTVRSGTLTVNLSASGAPTIVAENVIKLSSEIGNSYVRVYDGTNYTDISAYATGSWPKIGPASTTIKVKTSRGASSMYAAKLLYTPRYLGV